MIEFYSLEVTSWKVLKKLAYYTLLGGHSKKLFLDQSFALILNLQTLEFYLYPNSGYCKKTNRYLGWAIKRNVDCAK